MTTKAPSVNYAGSVFATGRGVYWTLVKWSWIFTAFIVLCWLAVHFWFVSIPAILFAIFLYLRPRKAQHKR